MFTQYPPSNPQCFIYLTAELKSYALLLHESYFLPHKINSTTLILKMSSVFTSGNVALFSGNATKRDN